MKLYGLIVALSIIQIVSSTGTLKLKFKTFKNPNHRLFDGSCCDNAITRCSDYCDNYFKVICLTSPKGTKCGIGSSSTGVIQENGDNLSFGNKVGSLDNPLVYSFEKWEGSFILAVEVWDKDGGYWKGDDDKVLDRYDNVIIAAARDEDTSTRKSIVLKNDYSRLDLEVRVFCDAGYLIPACKEHCKFTNDSSGHYRCDFINGKIICLDGWYGDKCLTKRKHCVPRDDDMGHYTCDKMTGDIVCIPGWRNESAKCIEEIDECKSSPCLNRGDCNDLINDFNCSCKPGYTGKICQTDINECASNPCKFGACIQSLNNYTCDCYEGYEGRHCKTVTDNCHGNRCNHGRCINAVNAFTCICDLGYTGTLCDKGSPIQSSLRVSTTNARPSMDVSRTLSSDKSKSFPTTSMQIRYHSSTVDLSKIKIASSKSLPLATTEAPINRETSLTKVSSKINPTIPKVKSSSDYGRFLTTQDKRSSEYKLVKTSIHENVKLSSVSHVRMTASKIGSETAMLTRTYGIKSNGKRIVISPSTSNIKISVRKTERGTEKVEMTATSRQNGFHSNYGQGTSLKGIQTIIPSKPMACVSSTALYGPKHQNIDVRFTIEIEGDIKKWDAKAEEILKREICLSVFSRCELDFGCVDSNKSANSQIKIERGKRHGKLFSSLLTFTKMMNASENTDDIVTCFQEAINESSKRIETMIPFKITSVRAEKKGKKTDLVSRSKDSEELLTSVISGSDSKHEENSGAFDTSKILASIVVGHVFIITAVLLAIKKLRRCRLEKRVQPSPILTAHDESITESQFNEIRPFGKLQITKTPSTSTGAAKERMKLKTPTLQERNDERMLLETDDKHLETFFL